MTYAPPQLLCLGVFMQLSSRLASEDASAWEIIQFKALSMTKMYVVMDV